LFCVFKGVIGVGIILLIHLFRFLFVGVLVYVRFINLGI